MASTIDPTTGLPITNQAIPTSALSTPQTPIVPVTPQYDVNGITTGANQSSAYITSTLQNTQNEEQAKADLAKTNLANETSSMATLASQLNGQGTGLRSSTIDQANQITGATDKLNMLNRINAESQGLLFRRDVIPMETAKAYEGSSGVQSGMESVNRDVLQRNAIQLANNAKLAAIASADYNAAQNESNKLVNLKYDGVIAEINAKKANIENIRGNLTEAQKKVADAQTRLLDKQKQDELDKKAAETAVNNMLIEASPVAPPDVIAKATKIKNEGGSAIQVAAALGVYAGNYVQNEYIKSQTAKNYADAIESKVKANLARTAALAGGTPAEIKAKVEAQTAQITQAQNILGLVNDIAGSTGLARGTGFSSLLNVVPGTTGKDFEVTVDQLKNALALPNLGQLKGAMSDKDIMFLKNIATKLDTSMSEPEFKKELTKLQDKFTEVLTNNGVSPEALTDEYFKAQEKARVESQSTKSKDEQFLNSL